MHITVQKCNGAQLHNNLKILRWLDNIIADIKSLNAQELIIYKCPMVLEQVIINQKRGALPSTIQRRKRQRAFTPWNLNRQELHREFNLLSMERRLEKVGPDITRVILSLLNAFELVDVESFCHGPTSSLAREHLSKVCSESFNKFF